jgi:hypothetical protein
MKKGLDINFFQNRLGLKLHRFPVYRWPADITKPNFNCIRI